MQTIDTISGVSISPKIPRPDSHNRGTLSRISTWILWRAQIRRSRADLMQLNEWQLRDIGLTREQAGLEGNLPWWR